MISDDIVTLTDKCQDLHHLIIYISFDVKSDWLLNITINITKTNHFHIFNYLRTEQWMIKWCEKFSMILSCEGERDENHWHMTEWLGGPVVDRGETRPGPRSNKVTMSVSHSLTCHLLVIQKKKSALNFVPTHKALHKASCEL